MKAPGVVAVLAALCLLCGAEQAFAFEERVVVSGPVEVREGETSGDVVVADGSVRIAGTVDGYVVSLDAPVTILGRVDGDVISLSERVRLAPGAVVDGDVFYGDQRPIVAPGAQLTGDVRELDFGEILTPFGGAAHFAFWLAASFSSLALGLLLLWFFPRAAEAALATARERAGPAIGIGIAFAIVLPLAAFVSIVTLIGVPFGVALLFALLPLSAVCYVTCMWLLGRATVRPPSGRLAAFLAGWAVFRAVALVPWLGWLVWVGAGVFGLGVLLVAAWQAREAPEAAPAS